MNIEECSFADDQLLASFECTCVYVEQLQATLCELDGMPNIVMNIWKTACNRGGTQSMRKP